MDKLNAGLVFYRWKNVMAARREAGQGPLKDEDDKGIPDTFEWKIHAAAKVYWIGIAQHAEYIKVQEAAAKEKMLREAEETRKANDAALLAAEGRGSSHVDAAEQEAVALLGHGGDETVHETLGPVEIPMSGSGLGPAYIPMFPSTRSLTSALLDGLQSPATPAASVASPCAASPCAASSKAASPRATATAMPATASANVVNGNTAAGPTDKVLNAPDHERLAHHMSMKVDRKLSDKLFVLKMAQDNKELSARLDELSGRCDIDHGSIEQMLVDIANIMQAMGLLDEAARRAAEAARLAALAANKEQAQVEVEESDGFEDERAKLQRLEEALMRLREQSTDNDEKHDAELAEVNERLAQLDLLPSKVYHIELDLIPKKADQVMLDKTQIDVDELVKRMADMTGMMGMTPEMEEALAMLRSMREIKKLIAQHADKLADLFVIKATNDDVEKTAGMVQDLDAKMAAEIEREVEEILKKIELARGDWQKNLNHLGQTVEAKAESTWLSELEASIRAEIERLNAKGTGVTKKELDRYLAELRAKMEDMNAGGEGGSAAFRCIACDRTLPQAADWRKQKPLPTSAARAAGLEPSMLANRHHQNRARTAATGQSERIYKAGFPMVNPKIRPRKRKLFN